MWNSRPCAALVLFGLAHAAGCVSSQLSPNGATPTVTAMTPTSGPVGTIVQLEGSGFPATGNVVKFGPGYLVDLRSADARTLRFTVPEGHNLCPPEHLGLNEPCREMYPRVTPGDYPVAVVTASGSSRSMTFSVTSP